MGRPRNSELRSERALCFVVPRRLGLSHASDWTSTSARTSAERLKGLTLFLFCIQLWLSFGLRALLSMMASSCNLTNLTSGIWRAVRGLVSPQWPSWEGGTTMDAFAGARDEPGRCQRIS